MFGKVFNDANYKKARKWFGKTIKKTYHAADNASKWVGKLSNGIRQGYDQGKDYALNTADKIDRNVGLGGAARGITEAGIAAFEDTKGFKEARDKLDTADKYNKAFRDGAINNGQIKKFMNV
jgi:hypothetical protein